MHFHFCIGIQLMVRHEISVNSSATMFLNFEITHVQRIFIHAHLRLYSCKGIVMLSVVVVHLIRVSGEENNKLIQWLKVKLGC